MPHSSKRAVLTAIASNFHEALAAPLIMEDD